VNLKAEREGVSKKRKCDGDGFRLEQQGLLSFPSLFVPQDLPLDLEQNTIVEVDVYHRLRPSPLPVRYSDASSEDLPHGEGKGSVRTSAIPRSIS
jgi:hypothetical protein